LELVLCLYYPWPFLPIVRLGLIMILKQKRTIRSYVLRQGRMTDAQKTSVEKLMPKYGIELSEDQINFSEVFGRTGDVILEIGFGMGQSLAQMGLENPDINYVGIEVHQPGVGRLMNQLEDENISNVRVLNEDAVQVLKAHIPNKSLAGVQIFFPDPWPKKKHNKRRIIQKEFIKHIIGKLSVGGFIHVATDWAPYAEHIIEVLNSESGLVSAEGTSLHKRLIMSRPDTRFENRGKKLGHEICDVVYQTV
jgi:tRNA (guanine-N7-)-methyltransferase